MQSGQREGVRLWRAAERSRISVILAAAVGALGTDDVRQVTQVECFRTVLVSGW